MILLGCVVGIPIQRVREGTARVELGQERCELRTVERDIASQGLPPFGSGQVEKDPSDRLGFDEVQEGRALCGGLQDLASVPHPESVHTAPNGPRGCEPD